jgi:hypothetical protein
MNLAPGRLDPQNSVIPFAQFDRLHFARILILQDQTLDDITVYGLPRANYPTYLAILGDCDGSVETFLNELVTQVETGLRSLFMNCKDYTPSVNLAAWIKAHTAFPAANYVNWIGRTVQQVIEEEKLHQVLESFLQKNSDSIGAMEPGETRKTLKEFVAAEERAGRITLTPTSPTPVGWQVRNLLHLVGMPLLLLMATPLLLLAFPFLLIQLRRRENSDPEVAPRVDRGHADLLASLEDHEVTNSFSAMGSLKPGLFRRALTTFALGVIDYTVRHIYCRGRLARVTSIQFARWVFLDGGRRMIFASNYDGSLESYMDDFINKVAFGLNVVFSNGIGYPRTKWLVLNGAKDEQTFKDYLRRHQMPTQVWYNAFPGLTALDKRRNALIREGLEKSHMTGSETRQWLRLL